MTYQSPVAVELGKVEQLTHGTTHGEWDDHLYAWQLIPRPIPK